MEQIITAAQAAAMIPSGARVMFSGFLGCGNPLDIIEAIYRRGTDNLTMICDDASLLNGPDGKPYYGVARLVHNHQISHFIGTHVGTNPEIYQQMTADEVTIDLVPMGSFVEMIRAGGSGLGGVLSPTGIGTLVEESPFVHSKLHIDGRDFLVMRPLRADFAVITGTKVDEKGNIWYRGTARNFAPWMAMAADQVIVEAEELVDPGCIAPEDVVTPGILVDYIVVRGGTNLG